MSGNLHKLGRIFKTWKQRYFEIQGCNMYYYKNVKVRIEDNWGVERGWSWLE